MRNTTSWKMNRNLSNRWSKVCVVDEKSIVQRITRERFEWEKKCLGPFAFQSNLRGGKRTRRIGLPDRYQIFVILSRMILTALSIRIRMPVIWIRRRCFSDQE